jgi:uncharacterized protein
MAVEPLHLNPGAGRDASPEELLRAPVVTAFVGRTERGPLNEPVCLRAFHEFRRVFGGHCGFSFLSHAVQHYFQHGGEAAVVVRVANRATRGRIDLPADGQTMRVQAVDPGSRESLRVSVDYDGVEEEGRFNLVVQRVNGPGWCAIEDQELYRGLSMDENDDRFVIDALQDSALIRLAGPLPKARPDATLAASPGAPIPYVELTAAGSDGDELTDYDIIGSNSEGTGLFALDRTEQVDLVCIPPPARRDLGATTFVAAERYCARRRAMLIWDPPWAWQSAETALMDMRACAPTGANALGYFPRLLARDEQQRFPQGMPACGAIAGMLTQSAPWRGERQDATLKGDLRPLVALEQAQIARLRRIGLNVLGRDDAGHYALRGNVTLASVNVAPSQWRALDGRRTALFVVGTVERWARRDLACGAGAALTRRVNDFLAALHEQGVLAATQPAEVVHVKACGGGEPQRIRFGFALEQPGAFLTYEIRSARERIEVRRVRAAQSRALAG